MQLSEEIINDLDKPTLIILVKEAQELYNSYERLFNTLANRVTMSLLSNPEMISNVFPGLYKLPKISAMKVIRTYLMTSLPLTLKIYEKGLEYEKSIE